MNTQRHIHKIRMHGQRGFTLIELMVAMAISLILLAGVLGAFTAQDKAYRLQNNLTELQQNLRVAVEFMSDDIQLAGYGAPDDEDNWGIWYDWAPIAGVFTANPTIIDGVAGAPDTLMIAASFDPAATELSADEDFDSKSMSIAAGSGDQFDSATNKLVFIGRYEYAQVTNVPGSGSTISINTDPADLLGNGSSADGIQTPRYEGDPVELVQVVSYYVLNEMLMRDDNAGNALPLIINVEDFQVVQVGDSLSVTISARTRQEDMDYKDADPARTDGYRRASVTFRTDMRNLCTNNCF